MENQTEGKSIRIHGIRWVARAWSIASIGLLLGFVIGEGINPSTPTEIVGLLLFPLGVSIGMIVGWSREGLGGTITVTSLLAFYLIHIVTAGTLPKGWAWLAFSVPGFLFLLCGLLSRRT